MLAIGSVGGSNFARSTPFDDFFRKIAMPRNLFSCLRAVLALGALSTVDSHANEPAAEPAPVATEAAPTANPLLDELKALVTQIEASGETLELVEKAGDLYLRLGDAQRAVILYQKAIEQFGGSEMVYLKLARTLLLAGRPELGVEILKVAQKAYPGSAALLFELGQAYNSQGKHYAAASVLKQAMALDPEESAYPFHLAIALRSQKKFEEALALIDGLVANGSEELPVQLVRGDLLVAMGNEREAVAYIEGIYEKTSDNPDVKLLLSHAYRRFAAKESAAGRITRAIRNLEKAIELDQDIPELRSQIATLHYEAGEFLEAEKQVKLAIESHPESLSAYGVYSTVLMALERPDEAREVLQKGLLQARAVKDAESVKYFEQILIKRVRGAEAATAVP